MTAEGWHHRIYKPSLGGGALLDLGIYPLTWACLALLDDPDNVQAMPDVAAASMLFTEPDGEDGFEGPVDEQTSLVLRFNKLRATAVLTCNLSFKTPVGQCVVIQGSKVLVLHCPQLLYCSHRACVDLMSTPSTG